MTRQTTDELPAASRGASAARTRAAVIGAAANLFAERGYRAVSLRDIAAAGGISHPGLLRHFASKDDLLRAVVEQLDEVNRHVASDGATSLDAFVQVARQNDASPGYSRLLLGLVGIALSPCHPEHQAVAARYEMAREGFAEAFRQFAAEMHSAVDADAEGIRMAAAWDGAQLIALYLPEVDVPSTLGRRLATLGAATPRELMTPLPPAASAPPAMSGADSDGYASGRARRAEIVAAAAERFAADGYHLTSLREVAAAAGTGPSTLVHHFGGKQQLLIAVLDQQEAELAGMQDDGGSEPGRLWSLPQRVQHHLENASQCVRLQATLRTEAVAADHPAHEHFARRYRARIGDYATAIARAQEMGSVRGERDPWFEALWLVALSDGLHLQWLYAPAAVDPATLLTGYLDELRTA
ncbi:TetR/AcrR family transcriptional regulator [Promicromonospora sp. NFX87]|uniref:TetR/AcrR family transcriptional regulator n=1 Tax=Promicromonospora sp. NFX87 TaxID=3402691 RepID=UPI003AFA8D5C